MPMLNDHEVGRCGNCGGAVVVPMMWHGIQKPTPTCEDCGSTAATSGPVIPMNPRPRR